MNLHETDIRLDQASVEYLDDKLTILADDSAVAITLEQKVVDDIRDELNTEYQVRPRTEDSMHVVRTRDSLRAIVSTDVLGAMKAWGFSFIAYIPDHLSDTKLGRFGGDSAIGAAKKAFAAYDESLASTELESGVAS